jgi:hypothetical protein
MPRTLQEAEAIIQLYEQNGPAKLYYAINKKMNEIADMLNSVNLKNIEIASKSDASFERVFKLLEKSESIGNAAKALGDLAGVTHDAEKDIKRKPFVDLIAEKRY